MVTPTPGNPRFHEQTTGGDKDVRRKFRFSPVSVLHLKFHTKSFESTQEIF